MRRHCQLYNPKYRMPGLGGSSTVAGWPRSKLAVAGIWAEFLLASSISRVHNSCRYTRLHTIWFIFLPAPSANNTNLWAEKEITKKIAAQPLIFTSGRAEEGWWGGLSTGHVCCCDNWWSLDAALMDAINWVLVLRLAVWWYNVMTAVIMYSAQPPARSRHNQQSPQLAFTISFVLHDRFQIKW